MQLAHNHHKPSTHHKEIILVCEHMTSPANAGSIFRLADAFGVKEIIFCGNQPDTRSSRLRKTARNTEKTIPFRASDTIKNTLQELHDLSFTSIALEITSNSKPMSTIDFSRLDKVALVIGAESIGITDETLEQCNNIAHITMYGINSSMNVAQATGIALYELTRS